MLSADGNKNRRLVEARNSYIPYCVEVVRPASSHFLEPSESFHALLLGCRRLWCFRRAGIWIAVAGTRRTPATASTASSPLAECPPPDRPASRMSRHFFSREGARTPGGAFSASSTSPLLCTASHVNPELCRSEEHQVSSTATSRICPNLNHYAMSNDRRRRIPQRC